jgi:hypothetical protein
LLSSIRYSKECGKLFLTHNELTQLGGPFIIEEGAVDITLVDTYGRNWIWELLLIFGEEASHGYAKLSEEVKTTAYY